MLKRELGPNGFAFAITVAVGGGAALQNIWQSLEDSSDHEFGTDIDSTSCASTVDAFSSPSGWERNETYRKLRRWISSQDVSPSSRALLSNLIASTFAIILLQGRRGRYRPIFRPAENIDIPLTMPIDVNATKYGPSPTLDLTLLLLVRAVDAKIQSMVFKKSESYWTRNLSTVDILGAHRELLLAQPDTVEADRKKEETLWRQRMTTRIDAFIFWACSARSAIATRILTATGVLMLSPFTIKDHVVFLL